MGTNPFSEELKYIKIFIILKKRINILNSWSDLFLNVHYVEL